MHVFVALVHVTYTCTPTFYIFPFENSLIIPDFICMLLRINYSGNYAGILDASLNAGYSNASFKLVVVSAVMSQQLTIFGKVTASRKAYGKQTNNYEQFVNAFVTDELLSLVATTASKEVG